MIGRAGILGIFAKKQLSKKETYIRRYRQKLVDECRDHLIYRKYPWAIWILGVLFILASIYFFIHLFFVVPDTLFSSFKKGTWWQYLVALSLYLCGIAFLFSGKKNVVEINRSKDLISVTKTNLCLRRKVQKRRASDCLRAAIVKKGIDDISTNTVHYKLVLEFEDEKSLQILETDSRAQIKKRYVEVTDYLDLDMNLDRIPIDDQTETRKVRAEAKAKKNATASKFV